MSTGSPEPRQDATDSSRVLAAGARLRNRLSSLRDSLARSLADEYDRSTIGRIGAAYQASGLNRLASSVWRSARRSWLYRWLMAEPDPDVIVIDLRETWTVGPLLAMLERVLAPLDRAIASSRATRLARRIAAGVGLTTSDSQAVFANSRTCAAITAVLEPPEMTTHEDQT